MLNFLHLWFSSYLCWMYMLIKICCGDECAVSVITSDLCLGWTQFEPCLRRRLSGLTFLCSYNKNEMH
jgi:hypothetical protein